MLAERFQKEVQRYYYVRGLQNTLVSAWQGFRPPAAASGLQPNMTLQFQRRPHSTPDLDIDR